MRRFAVSSVLFIATTAVSLLLADPITIMPMGDSITAGFGVAGGYRQPLYNDLNSAGLSFKFVGSTDTGATTTLTNAGDQYHNGYGSYTIQAIDNNLAADEQYEIGGQPYGDSNAGGYWLKGGPDGTVDPDFILLEIGTNDFLNQDYAGIDARIKQLVQDIHADAPDSIVLIAGCIPVDGDAGFDAVQAAYDTYISGTLVPEYSYLRYVDLYDDFITPNAQANYYQSDNIHPDATGYSVIASDFANSIDQIEGVPEPSTWALFVLAGVVLLAGRRRLAGGAVKRATPTS